MSLLISCAIPIVERYTGESILQKGINIFSGGCEEVFRKALEVFGKVKEHAEFTATLEVPRQDLKELSKLILDRLPVVDFNIEDIPVEEGIALLYQRQETSHALA